MIFLVQFGINKHLLIFQRPQTELDDKKYCHRLIKTMTKFEKEIRHRLFVFIKKKTTINSAKCETTARVRDAFCPLNIGMTC